MANIKSAKKRAVQNEKLRNHNVALKSAYRTSVKKVEAAVKNGNLDEANAALKASIPAIDKVASKKIIHKNAAARCKSRLSKKVSSLRDKK